MNPNRQITTTFDQKALQAFWHFEPKGRSRVTSCIAARETRPTTIVRRQPLERWILSLRSVAYDLEDAFSPTW
jgi:hypothetical protein